MRRDDDHRGRGREAAEEGEQRDAVLPGHIGSVSTNMSGFDAPAGSAGQPGERDRQHEQRDQEQVEREQPRARCADAARRRSRRPITWNWRGRQRSPPSTRKVSVIQRGAEHLASASAAGRAARPAREEVAGAVDRCRTRRTAPTPRIAAQLDDRLEGDRRDHAVVVLVGVDVARAEQDREDRHAERDPERGVVPDCDARRGRGSRARRLQQRSEARRAPPSAAARCRASMPTTAISVTSAAEHARSCRSATR